MKVKEEQVMRDVIDELLDDVIIRATGDFKGITMVRRESIVSMVIERMKEKFSFDEEDK